jgi:hypothetical protein
MNAFSICEKGLQHKLPRGRVPTRGCVPTRASSHHSRLLLNEHRGLGRRGGSPPLPLFGSEVTDEGNGQANGECAYHDPPADLADIDADREDHAGERLAPGLHEHHGIARPLSSPCRLRACTSRELKGRLAGCGIARPLSSRVEQEPPLAGELKGRLAGCGIARPLSSRVDQEPALAGELKGRLARCGIARPLSSRVDQVLALAGELKGRLVGCA